MTSIPNLPALKQRLGELNLKRARYGINAPPEVEIEARDLETVVQQMGLIDIQRANLEHLLKQRATLGTHVPPHIATQIQSNRQEIARLRAVCSKYGHPVAAHPLDSDESGARPAPNEPAPLSSDPITVVREKLRDIEAMLRAGLVDQALRLVRELQQLL